ncbi:hypothetical protein [Duganella sp. LjRoot269]|uniref:hypothetical protein n=1 Tax=Duganella sp. LjRoot269 TaxID=3342305 RepID=UPI003ECF81F8
MISRQFIEELDEQLIRDDVPLHARPFNVALAWIQQQNVSWNVLDPKIWNPLNAIYRELYLSGDFSVPSLLAGAVQLPDTTYLATAELGYGQFMVDPVKSIDISASELQLIWQRHPDQVWSAIYSVADIWDLAYSIGDLSGKNLIADDLWANSCSAITSTAHALKSGAGGSSAIQSACLSAELAMKGVLAYLGQSESQLRRYGHNIEALSKAVVERVPRANDHFFLAACVGFPNYVESRYASHQRTKIQLGKLGMRAQYVAAEAIRRLSKRDFAATIEGGNDSIPRLNFD